MKNLQLSEMEKISAAFKWNQFFKGVCEGITIGLIFTAAPPIAIARGTAVSAAVCQFID